MVSVVAKGVHRWVLAPQEARKAKGVIPLLVSFLEALSKLASKEQIYKISTSHDVVRSLVFSLAMERDVIKGSSGLLPLLLKCKELTRLFMVHLGLKQHKSRLVMVLRDVCASSSKNKFVAVCDKDIKDVLIRHKFI